MSRDANNVLLGDGRVRFRVQRENQRHYVDPTSIFIISQCTSRVKCLYQYWVYVHVSTRMPYLLLHCAYAAGLARVGGGPSPSNPCDSPHE